MTGFTERTTATHDTLSCPTCVRCQQPFQLTAFYQVAHICRRCRNGLIAAFNQAREDDT